MLHSHTPPFLWWQNILGTLDVFGKAPPEYMHQPCASPPLTTSERDKDERREKHNEIYTTTYNSLRGVAKIKQINYNVHSLRITLNWKKFLIINTQPIITT